MVRQYTIGGPIQRGMGYRLHIEMGEAGEAIWGAITGGQVLGGKQRFRATWRGAPPVDVIDWDRRVGYQVKVTTDKNSRITFSGSHKRVKYSPGKRTYVGEPADKLEDIQGWVDSHGLTAVLIVMLLDEDANRASVYAMQGVHSPLIREMEPIGVIDNDAGVFHVPRLLKGGIERAGIPIPERVEGLPRFPNIPAFLRSTTTGEVPVEPPPGVRPLFRRVVRVRRHRRRR